MKVVFLELKISEITFIIIISRTTQIFIKVKLKERAATNQKALNKMAPTILIGPNDQ